MWVQLVLVLSPCDRSCLSFLSQAHWALVTNDQPIKGLIEQIKRIATIDLKHIPLVHN